MPNPLDLGNLAETADRRPCGGSSGSSVFFCRISKGKCPPPPRLRGQHIRNDPGTTSDGLLACPALPDPDRGALDGGFTAESAGVAGVLGDFHLLNLFSQGGTISVFSPLDS